MTTETKTLAEQMAARYNDDGQKWRDADDLPIWTACERTGAVERRLANGDQVFTFADESAIVMMGTGWDVAELDACPDDDGRQTWTSTFDRTVQYR